MYVSMSVLPNVGHANPNPHPQTATNGLSVLLFALQAKLCKLVLGVCLVCWCWTGWYVASTPKTATTKEGKISSWCFFPFPFLRVFLTNGALSLSLFALLPDSAIPERVLCNESRRRSSSIAGRATRSMPTVGRFIQNRSTIPTLVSSTCASQLEFCS